jgi:hypothetical protein
MEAIYKFNIEFCYHLQFLWQPNKCPFLELQCSAFIFVYLTWYYFPHNHFLDSKIKTTQWSNLELALNFTKLLKLVALDCLGALKKSLWNKRSVHCFSCIQHSQIFVHWVNLCIFTTLQRSQIDFKFGFLVGSHSNLEEDADARTVLVTNVCKNNLSPYFRSLYWSLYFCYSSLCFFYQKTSSL